MTSNHRGGPRYLGRPILVVVAALSMLAATSFASPASAQDPADASVQIPSIPPSESVDPIALPGASDEMAIYEPGNDAGGPGGADKAVAAPAAVPLASSDYPYIVNRLTKKCVGESDGGASESVGGLHQWGCNGDSTQRWEIVANGTDSATGKTLYQFTSYNKGRCLTDNGSSYAYLSACTGSSTQKWLIYLYFSTADGLYAKLRNKYTGEDLYQWSYSDKAWYQTYSSCSTSGCHWFIRR